MQRNWHVWRSLLILCGLAAAIALPILGLGAADLGAARQLQARKDHPAAATRFESAARRLFWRGNLWEEAGREALAAGSPEMAIRLLKRDPHLSSHGWLALGGAYLQIGEPDPALQAYESALDQEASAAAYAGLAEVHRLRGEPEAERTALQSQLAITPDDPAAHYRLGLLLMLSDTNHAVSELQIASQMDSEYTPVFQSLRSTMTLAELSSTEAGRLITLGRGLGLAGEWALAAQAFEQATQADAGSAEAWAWLGEAKQHLGEDAAADLQRSLSLDSTSVVVRGLRGLYWKRLGNYRQALAEYQAAVAAEPDNPTWIASLAEAYARTGNLVSALESYQRATEVAPGESLYWRLLASFCAEYGVQAREVGLPAAEKAVELAPGDVQALDVLGSTQLTAGQYDPAQTTLLKAIGEGPDYAPAHLHLGMVYLQTGNRNGAYNELRLAVELDPNGATGQQAGQILKQYFP